MWSRLGEDKLLRFVIGEKVKDCLLCRRLVEEVSEPIKKSRGKSFLFFTVSEEP